MSKIAKLVAWRSSDGKDGYELQIRVYEQGAFFQFFTVFVSGQELLGKPHNRVARTVLNVSLPEISWAISTGAVPLGDRREAYWLGVDIPRALRSMEDWPDEPIAEDEEFPVPVDIAR